jgi:pantothenate kinase
MHTFTVATLTSHILGLVKPGQRFIVALAGPPGSGKSTVADAVCDALNKERAVLASILPMDGYHYDDGLLTQMGRLPFKGAPDTFDVGGFAHTLKRLKAQDEPQVAVPVFDRSLEISRGSARMIARDVPIIISEGNYLLLDDKPWRDLRLLYDLTVGIETSVDVLRQRLEARWRGFGLAEGEVQRKVNDNDLPNAKFVMERMGRADARLLT